MQIVNAILGRNLPVVLSWLAVQNYEIESHRDGKY